MEKILSNQELFRAAGIKTPNQAAARIALRAYLLGSNTYTPDPGRISSVKVYYATWMKKLVEHQQRGVQGTVVALKLCPINPGIIQRLVKQTQHPFMARVRWKGKKSPETVRLEELTLV